MTRQTRRYYVRKGERAPGFKAMPNKRVDALYAQAMLALGNREAALNFVAKRLPSETKRNWSIKPSKSDDEVWRNREFRR